MATKRTSKVLTVSVPPETAEDFDRIAKDEGRNRSELFREMLRVYRTFLQTRTFGSLQRYGAAQPSRKGITTETDVERAPVGGEVVLELDQGDGSPRPLTSTGR